MDTAVELEDQPFDAESVGDSEDADLVPIQSGEDWVAQLDWGGLPHQCSATRGYHVHHAAGMDMGC